MVKITEYDIPDNHEPVVWWGYRNGKVVKYEFTDDEQEGLSQLHSLEQEDCAKQPALCRDVLG